MRQRSTFYTKEIQGLALKKKSPDQCFLVILHATKQHRLDHIPYQIIPTYCLLCIIISLSIYPTQNNFVSVSRQTVRWTPRHYPRA